jgi:stress-induced morphogen
MNAVTRHERIESKLRETFHPSHLDVVNESHTHNVPKGSETHFKVVVVSDAFETKSSVARHQLVYAAVADEMKSGLHALAITSKTPAEWSTTQAVAESPECLGGSKR